MSVKLTDVVKVFSGDGKIDILEWLKKAELVAKLQKVEELAAFIPLFLEGDAFAIYDQLSEESQADYKTVKSSLIAAFSMTPFQAYESFKARDLKTGESPDAYMADLKRLQSMFLSCEADELLAVQFVSGLPSDVAGQLKALREGSTDTKKLLECAKQLLKNRAGDDSASNPPSGATGKNVRLPEGRPGQGGGKRCSGCFRIGHAQKDCLVVCFGCGRKGHFQRNCPENARKGGQGAGNLGRAGNSENGQGGAPQGSADLDASPYPPMGFQQ